MRCQKHFQQELILAVSFCKKYCYGTSTSSITSPHLETRPPCSQTQVMESGRRDETQWGVEPVPWNLHTFYVKTLIGKQAPCTKRQAHTSNLFFLLLLGWLSVIAVLLATVCVQQAGEVPPLARQPRAKRLFSGKQCNFLTWVWFQPLLEGCLSLGTAKWMASHMYCGFLRAGSGSAGLDGTGRIAL